MISIVTAYFNRKEIFKKTLESINSSVIKDIEVIVVDDGSREEERLEDLVDEFPFLKIIRLEKENKWYVNPCIPFNIGFKHVKGDKVIIQNPECFHKNDILKYTYDNLEDDKYISYGCYSVNEEKTKLILDNKINLSFFEFLPKRCSFDGDDGWYNHSYYRPEAFHFCSAITKKDLNDLGGFDERYADGYAWDDNELVHRIKLKKMNIEFVDNKVALHLWHYGNDENKTTFNQHSRNQEFWVKWMKNEQLFKNETLKSINYKVNKL
jgi:GT2 family glycosyltransferase